jgi:hypothetical protein
MMLSASSCLLLLSACSTDKAFDDLDDIDLTIQVGSTGLTLPIGSTTRIPLTEAMDPATVEVLDTLANGDFVIHKTGSFDPTSVEVDPVTVSITPSITPAGFGFEATLPAGDVKTAVDAYLAQHPAVSIDPLSQIPGVEGETSIESVQYQGIAFDDCRFDFRATEVDEALLALRSARLATPKEIAIELAISGLPDQDRAYNIELTHVLVGLPEYLQVTGQEAGRINIGDLTLEKAAGQSTASTTLTYQLTGIDYSDCRPGGQLETVNRTLTDQGQITLTADARIDRSLTITTSELKLEDGVVKLSTPISITPQIRIGDITFTSIVGRFDPTIDPIHTDVTLDLGDDMDFLKEDATIDLTNPVIVLSMQNTCDVKVLADLELTASNGSAPVTVTDVDLSQEVITLSRQAVSGADYNVVVDQLSTLLNPIPDRIDVRISPRADRAGFYPFNLGQTYSISGDYNVSAPLEFNNLDIKYDETVENVFGDTPEDVQDIADKLPQGIQDAVLSFTVTNAIPVSLDLEVTAVDNNGREDASLLTYTGSQTIPAGTIQAPATSAQKITLGISDVAAVRDLIVRVHGTASGVTLNAAQYVRFDDMKITIKKVTLDLDDDDD